MQQVLAPHERPLHWIGPSKRDLLVFPQPVIHEIGWALGTAQRGEKHRLAKPWKGQGPGILEIVSNFDGNTFRSVYTVQFREAIYVLHCFQKKSPDGIRTAKPDVELIARRLKAAKADYETRYQKSEK